MRNFKEEFERQYNIYLQPTVTINYNRHTKRYDPFIVNEVVPNQKGFNKLNYSYAIIGNILDVDKAVEGIDKTMNEYTVETDSLPRMTKE